MANDTKYNTQWHWNKSDHQSLKLQREHKKDHKNILYDSVFWVIEYEMSF